MILPKAIRTDKQEEIYNFFCRQDIHKYLIKEFEKCIGMILWSRITLKMCRGPRSYFKLNEYKGSDLGKTFGESLWQPILGKLLYHQSKKDKNLIFTTMTTNKTDKYDFCLNKYRIEFKTGQGSTIQGSSASDKSPHFLIIHYTLDYDKIIMPGYDNDRKNIGIIKSMYIGMHFNWLTKKYFQSNGKNDKNHRTQLSIPLDLYDTANYGSCCGYMDYARKKDGSQIKTAKYLGFRDKSTDEICERDISKFKSTLPEICEY